MYQSLCDCVVLNTLTYHSLIIHFLADGYLSAFQVLAFEKKEGGNPTIIDILFFSGQIPKGRMFESSVIRMFNFLRNCQIVSQSDYAILHSSIARM